MKKTKFETAFQTTTRDLNQGAVIDADGHYVEVTRQPAGRRALFTFDDTPRTRDLLDQYERKQLLDIPTKTILQSRTDLHHRALRVCMEGL